MPTEDLVRIPMESGVYIVDDDNGRPVGIGLYKTGYIVEVPLDRVQMRAFAEQLMRASAPPVIVGGKKSS